MIKYFTIEDLLKHYLQKKFHILFLPADIAKVPAGFFMQLNTFRIFPLV